jgi:hypothetical protein
VAGGAASGRSGSSGRRTARVRHQRVARLHPSQVHRRRARGVDRAGAGCGGMGGTSPGGSVADGAVGTGGSRRRLDCGFGGHELRPKHEHPRLPRVAERPGDVRPLRRDLPDDGKRVRYAAREDGAVGAVVRQRLGGPRLRRSTTSRPVGPRSLGSVRGPGCDLVDPREPERPRRLSRHHPADRVGAPRTRPPPGGSPARCRRRPPA